LFFAPCGVRWEFVRLSWRWSGSRLATGGLYARRAGRWAMTAPSVLIVDADRRSAEETGRVLGGEGYSTALARSGEEALTIMERRPTFLVISEIVLPRMDGLAFLGEAIVRWPEVPFIILSVIRDVVSIVRVMRAGARNYLVKPVRRAVLLSTVGECRKKSGSPAHPGAPPGMVGASKSMLELYESIVVAQQGDFNVLLVGETGTGKELVAHAIHAGSERHTKPLIIHNCARAGYGLFESELFGHVRGAFTGAVRDRVGLLELAHDSDLFLDELECLPLDQQAEILRAIEDGEARAVGSSSGREVSVRYISATNRDLRELLAVKLFREDLYFRLAACEIRLPALRERTGDIPLLVDHLLELEGFAGKVTSEAMSALEAHHWPGNVRELKNVLRVAKGLATSRGERRIDRRYIKICELGLQGRLAAKTLELEQTPTSHQPPSTSSAGSYPGHNGSGFIVHGETLVEIIRDVTLQALRAAGGNRSQAAETLAIARTTLRRLLRAPGKDHA
jgi:DNA-binding NtrC family response regulator